MSAEATSGERAHRRLAEWVAYVVYGTLAVLAAAGGLALEPPALHAAEAAAVLIVVAATAWLGHSMWRVVRARARRDPVPDRSHELHELLGSWPIVASGLPAASVLLLAATGAWSVATALAIAQALGVVVLLGAGLATALLAGATGSRKLAYVFTLPFAGLVIVVLEVAAHKA